MDESEVFRPLSPPCHPERSKGAWAGFCALHSVQGDTTLAERLCLTQNPGFSLMSDLFPQIAVSLDGYMGDPNATSTG